MHMMARDSMKSALCLLGLAFTASLAPASAQETIRPVYETVFYKSGDLRIQAYLYKPAGEGSFPVVIYNHGSRRGHERDSVPFQYVGNLLLQRGFGVLVPERRGYGQSDGAQYSEEIGFDVGSRFIERLQAETGDVLASLDYLKTLPWVDQNRLGIMGWSFGGIVTMFATSRTDRFRAAVNQAGGSLTWPNSAALQKALKDATQKTKIPVLLMAAKNDRTTDSITELAKILDKNQTPHKMILYDPFKPAQNPGNIAPGHLIFSFSGYTIWQDDVRNFFTEHLAAEHLAPAGGK
jgi:dienelactone hydrolase